MRDSVLVPSLWGNKRIKKPLRATSKWIAKKISEVPAKMLYVYIWVNCLVISDIVLELYHFNFGISLASMIAVSYSIDGSECFGRSWEAVPIETKATAGRRKDSGRRLGRKKERTGGRRKNVELGRRKEGKDRGGGGRKEGERERILQ